MGLKLKYQFDEELMDPYITAKPKSNEDDELPAKKFKITDTKKISILEYSSVQLPVAPLSIISKNIQSLLWINA